jgi:glyoxylase-like metal-dependent hydrolase (beta-lactamase superfamily II)
MKISNHSNKNNSLFSSLDGFYASCMAGSLDVQEIAPEVFLFIGDAYRANAAAFVSGKEVLLVDGLASRRDARELKRVLVREWKKSVRWIISTHYFSDHMAAFGLFPKAPIVAHRNALHTFWSEDFRTPEEATHFVEPSLLVGEGVAVRWGSYHLDIFYNPGHTMCTLNVDVPEADLLFASDTAVGRIAYLHYGPPRLIREALSRALSRGRSRTVLGHGGPVRSTALEQARTYVDRLEKQVRQVRAGNSSSSTILEIPLESCLAEGIEGSDFERFFHERNLASVTSKNLFADVA